MTDQGAMPAYPEWRQIELAINDVFIDCPEGVTVDAIMQAVIPLLPSWQSIESAPKDGTEILAWRDDCGFLWVRWTCLQDFMTTGEWVIAARIADGYLPVAPIFTDVREFVQSGAAEQYRGIADVVSAGFPCQPHSQAGNRKGADDPRDMWPATLECLRIIRPRRALLENVTGLLAGYLGQVLGGLASIGYDAQWDCIPAAIVGQPHFRDRTWIVAYPHGQPGPQPHEWTQQSRERTPRRGDAGGLAVAQRVGQVKQKPGFVEWMMDWPIGWTDLKPLAMDRFQEWLHAHGRCSHD